MPESNKWDWDFMFKLADTLDQMEGLEAAVVRRRILLGYPHEQTAAELSIPIDVSEKIAADGLRKLKNSVFPPSQP